MNRKLLAVPALGMLALLLTGCASGASASSPPTASGVLTVVASTDVWGDIAASVGGEHIAVTSIIDGADKVPHEYQADARDQLALSKASVVIENGGGYDAFIDTMLQSSAHKHVTLNAVEISGHTAHSGAELNEHVWYDLPTVTKVIAALSDTFVELDPANSAAYTANALALTQQINALERRTAQLKTEHAGEGVAITEPVPLYLLQAIGLVNKTPEKFSEAIENGTDVAPSVLQSVLEIFRSHTVKLLVYNAQTAGAQTRSVLKAAGSADVPAVAVTETLPTGETYVSWMTTNIDALTAALGAVPTPSS